MRTGGNASAGRNLGNLGNVGVCRAVQTVARPVGRMKMHANRHRHVQNPPARCPDRRRRLNVTMSPLHWAKPSTFRCLCLRSQLVQALGRNARAKDANGIRVTTGGFISKQTTSVTPPVPKRPGVQHVVIGTGNPPATPTIRNGIHRLLVSGSCLTAGGGGPVRAITETTCQRLPANCRWSPYGVVQRGVA